MTRRIIQIYRGTSAQNDAFTGEAGELTMDTTNNELRLHDGTTQGGHKVGTSNYHPDLFDHKRADHLLNDVSWLRADTFSWHDGGVYEAAYDHLENDIDGKSLQSETVAGTTVQFYLADDGHKICPASEASNVATIYNATGVAWYYIIDTVNEVFKLPRTKFGFTGLRDTVGNYVPESLPNIKGQASWSRSTAATPTSSGALQMTQGGSSCPSNASGAGDVTLKINASNSSSTYQDGAPVQQRATQMYLYFYVGNFTQEAIENTAGLNASLFNNKADLDFNNTSMIDYVIAKQDPTAGNGYTWYRKYKSGWVEQGGKLNDRRGTVTFPITMNGSNYQATQTAYAPTPPSGAGIPPYINALTSTSMYVYNNTASAVFWEVKGMAA